MHIKTFDEIYQRAAHRKGGSAELEELLPVAAKSSEELAAIGDDRYLAAMTRAIFRAGFVWRVITNKWPGFEEAFWHFNIMRCAMMSHDDIDALCCDERIVRNGQKIKTVPLNAGMILEIQKSHGSFGQFIADWPQEDYAGLLEFLKKNGARLGGTSTQYFLREIGRDGFILGKDGMAALVDAGVIDKPATGKAAMQKIQAAYNQWHKESGRNFSQISRILSMSIDSTDS